MLLTILNKINYLISNQSLLQKKYQFGKFEIKLKYPDISYQVYLEQYYRDLMTKKFDGVFIHASFNINILKSNPALYSELTTQLPDNTNTSIFIGNNPIHKFSWVIEYKNKTITLIPHDIIPHYILGIIEHVLMYYTKPNYIAIRSACFSYHNKNFILVGDKFSYKTTILLNILYEGANFLSDDLTFISNKLKITPYLTPLSVRQDTFSYYPELYNYFEPFFINSTLFPNSTNSVNTFLSLKVNYTEKETSKIDFIFFLNNKSDNDFSISPIDSQTKNFIYNNCVFREKANWVKNFFSNEQLSDMLKQKSSFIGFILDSIPSYIVNFNAQGIKDFINFIKNT